jgi:hypothetical protein
VLGLLVLFGLIAVLLSGESRVVLPFTVFDAAPIQWIEKKARDRFSLAYALAALSVINAAALVPCAGFFKYAYDAASELSLKRDQILLSEEYLNRQENVGKYAVAAGAPREYVKTRLSQEWDRYDCGFFTTDCTQKEPSVSPTAQLSQPDPCLQSNGQVRMAPSGSAEPLNDWIERLVAEATFYFPTNQIGSQLSRMGVASTGAEEGSTWEHSVHELSPRCFRLDWKESSRLPNFHVTSHYLQWGGLGFRV